MSVDSNAGALFCLGLPAAICLLIWLRGRRAVARIAADLAAAQASAIDAQRIAWLATLPGLSYRNEIEVEVKLLAPLVAFAGYAPDQIAVRVPVAVQVGRSNANGQADWVLYANGQPHVIIEAKAPGQALNGAVQAQARSYAYALNAPLYLLTNGVELEIHQRGIQNDQLLHAIPVEQLASRWFDLSMTLFPPDNMN